MLKNLAVLALLIGAVGFTAGCRQGGGGDLENTVEDAAHETGQAAEEAGETVEEKAEDAAQ